MNLSPNSLNIKADGFKSLVTGLAVRSGDDALTGYTVKGSMGFKGMIHGIEVELSGTVEVRQTALAYHSLTLLSASPSKYPAYPI